MHAWCHRPGVQCHNKGVQLHVLHQEDGQPHTLMEYLGAYTLKHPSHMQGSRDRAGELSSPGSHSVVYTDAIQEEVWQPHVLHNSTPGCSWTAPMILKQ